MKSLISVFSNVRRLLTKSVLAVSALAIGACVFACSRSDDRPAGPPEKVTIAYSATPDSALAQVAQMKGYYLQEGLEVTPQKYALGKDALQAVLDGKADFATAAETPFMFAVMKGEKISVVATIQKSQKNYAIIARKDRGILTPRDLKGKKIAVRLGTSGDFFLDAFLNSHGMSRKDIKVIDLDPAGLRDALVKGDVDGISALPFVGSQVQKKLGDKLITFHDQEIFTQFFNVVATSEFIRSNPGKVKKILRAFIKAEEFINQNPAESQRIVSDFIRLDQALLGEIWDVNDFHVTLDQPLVLALEDLSQWAIEYRFTETTKVPNYLNSVYLDGLKAIKPGAVRILK